MTATIRVHAPHDQHLVGAYQPDDAAAVHDKVTRARAAMRTWAATPAAERGEALVAVADAAAAQLSELAEALSLEQGKTRREAAMELERFIGPFRQYAAMAAGAEGSPVDLGGGVTGRVELEPVGVAAGIVPWNFPASLLGTKLAPALAAGCAFLAKPAETTALITRRLVRLVADHVPDGLVDVVLGGPDTGRLLATHPGIARVAFTGSTAVGRQVAAGAAAALKRLTLELGGSDPFVLLEDADLGQAVRALMGTRFYNAGQVCVAPKRLVVRHEIADDVVSRLTERIGRVRPGPGLADGVTMGPLHTEATRARLEAQAADAADRGAEIVGGGRPGTPDTRDGWFLRPMLALDPPPDARVRTEETFGPLLAVIRVRDDDEAVRVAAETPYGLGCSVWSRDQARAFGVARRIPAGYTWVNALGRVHDDLPFGGVGESGFGREHGRDALLSYLEPRTFVYAS